MSIVLLATAKILPLLLAVTLFYTAIVTTIDIHQGVRSRANCLICKFTQNLSCGNDAGSSSLTSEPELQKTALFTDSSSFIPKAALSTVGSRSPPLTAPSVEG